MVLARDISGTLVLKAVGVSILLAFVGNFILHFASHENTESWDRDSPVKVLVAVVALGKNTHRSNVARKSVEHITSTMKHSRYKLECIMFVRAPYPEEEAKGGDDKWILEWEDNSTAPCFVTRVPGQNFVGFLKMLHPKLLQEAGYEHLFVLLDDVILYPPNAQLDLVSFLDIARRLDLAVASPSIKSPSHPEMKPQGLPPCRGDASICRIGRTIDTIEIFATVYRMDAWRCQWLLVDPEFPSGWGLDIWYKNFCKDKVPHNLMAVIDRFHVVHSYEFGEDSYIDPYPIMTAQQDKWGNDRGIELEALLPNLPQSEEEWLSVPSHMLTLT